MLTIRNPEKLNGKYLTITRGWNIEYMGRDLSLNEDNYRWDVWSDYSKVRGYYIVERELIEGSWLNVRWGLTHTRRKKRKELIDKSNEPKGAGVGGESIKENFIDSASVEQNGEDKLNKIYEKLDRDFMYNWIKGHKERK